MFITQDTIEFLKKVEGFSKKAYKIQGEDFYTIGYGTTKFYPSTNQKINKNDIIDKNDAELELYIFCERYINPVLEQCSSDFFKKNDEYFNEQQYIALISRLYNSGTSQWIKTNCWKAILNKDTETACKEWDFWKYTNIINQAGLKKRCNKEIELFFNIKNYWQ